MEVPMNWNQLQYVITIAQEKNITRAARKLYISQPSLSLSVQSLEKEIGAALFERSKGEMLLTYAGTLFYEWASATLRSQNQLNAKLNDISNARRSLIRIGMSPHRSLLVLPLVLERFYQDYPECEIHIIEKPTYLLKKLLETHEIDFMIDVMHPDTLNYQSDVLANEKILLAVPSAYALFPPFCCAGDRPVSLAALTDFPFILLTQEQILGSMSRRMCESASFCPNVKLICENVETALSLVNRALGITFVPEILSKQAKSYPNVSYYPVSQFYDTRQLCLVYPKNRYQHTQLAHLLVLLREMIPKLYDIPPEV